MYNVLFYIMLMSISSLTNIYKSIKRLPNRYDRSEYKYWILDL